jgi:hypothetical protein
LTAMISAWDMDPVLVKNLKREESIEGVTL